MTAYYNEHDPFAAAWLRNLISANLIAQGEVDERSIVDVRPDDLRGFTQCHFFAGIGIWSYALRCAGWPDDRPVWTGSCPCQSFSAAGARKGFDDKRHLWPEFFRLIRISRPDTILGEQVASKDALAWLDLVSTDLEGEDYAVGAVDTCAAGFGAPHIRQRLWWVADSGSQRRQQIGRSALSDEAAHGRARRNGSEPHGDYIAASDGKTGSMANSESQWNRSGNTRKGWRSESTDSSELGYSDPERPQGWRLSGNGSNELPAGSSSVDGRMAQSDGRHSSAERKQRSWQQRQLPSDPRTSRLGLTNSRGLSKGNGSSSSNGHRYPTLTAGFWSECSWLPCIDGKARPVEPGTFPLAHGYPNRVGTLRGYGNALVAPQAQAFIEAYMEI